MAYNTETVERVRQNLVERYNQVLDEFGESRRLQSGTKAMG